MKEGGFKHGGKETERDSETEAERQSENERNKKKGGEGGQKKKAASSHLLIFSIVLRRSAMWSGDYHNYPCVQSDPDQLGER